MTCDEIEQFEWHESYLLNLLPEIEKLDYELHLQSCQVCQERLAFEKKIVNGLRAIGAAEMRQEIKAQVSRQPQKNQRPAIYLKLAAAVFILVFSPTIYFLFKNEVEPQKQAESAPVNALNSSEFLASVPPDFSTNIDTEKNEISFLADEPPLIDTILNTDLAFSSPVNQNEVDFADEELFSEPQSAESIAQGAFKPQSFDKSAIEKSARMTRPAEMVAFPTKEWTFQVGETALRILPMQSGLAHEASLDSVRFTIKNNLPGSLTVAFFFQDSLVNSVRSEIEVKTDSNGVFELWFIRQNIGYRFNVEQSVGHAIRIN